MTGADASRAQVVMERCDALAAGGDPARLGEDRRSGPERLGHLGRFLELLA